MKYLLFTIVFCLSVYSPINAQRLEDTKESKEHAVEYGAVSIGTTIVKKEKLGLVQERITYVKNKYAEQKIALKMAIKEGEETVLKAKGKIALAKASLEADKQKNRISESVYIARKERLEMIEQKTKALEGTLMKN